MNIEIDVNSHFKKFPNATKIISNVDNHPGSTYAEFDSFGPEICEELITMSTTTDIRRGTKSDQSTSHGLLVQES